jgi:hypothetical protein
MKEGNTSRAHRIRLREWLFFELSGHFLQFAVNSISIRFQSKVCVYHKKRGSQKRGKGMQLSHVRLAQ